MGWWFDSWGGGLILGYKVPARFYVLPFLVDEITKPKTVQNLNRKTKDD